jgi:DNA-binding MarR family transcriptional regulator
MSTADAERILEAARRLYAATERFDAAAARQLGTDRTALRAMNAMERGDVTPSALGAALGLTSGSVTALVDRLERAGHVVRLADPHDRRRRAVALSPSARAAADPLYARLGVEIGAAFATLDAPAREAAREALETLARAFDRAAEAVRRAP